MDKRKRKKYNGKKEQTEGAVMVLARVKKIATEEAVTTKNIKKKPKSEEFLNRQRVLIPKKLFDLVEFSRRFQ